MAKYEVIHPVHNGKIHPRGSVVELDAHDGLTLLSSGHVTPVLLSETEVVDLETLTKEQLVSFALDKFDATLKPSLTKAEMITAIQLVLAETGK